MEEASYEGVRVFVVAATGSLSFSALRDVGANLAEAQLFEALLLEAEVMPEFMHDGHPHLAGHCLGRGARPLQRPAKNGDSVWRDEVILPSLGQRRPFVQAEQVAILSGGEIVAPGGGPRLGNLVSRWLVFDNHVNIIEHRGDFGREVIQRPGHEPREPLPPRLLDTVTNPVLHTANHTSFGVIPPNYGEPSPVRTPGAPLRRSRPTSGASYTVRP